MRLSADRFVAYDRRCTHLSCPVVPRPEGGRSDCPCHEGFHLWLFTATMEAYLGGDDRVVVPAALASLACLGLGLGLRRYLRALDH